MCVTVSTWVPRVAVAFPAGPEAPSQTRDVHGGRARGIGLVEDVVASAIAADRPSAADRVVAGAGL